MDIDLPRGDVGNYIGIICYVLGVLHYGWENAQVVYAKLRGKWSSQNIEEEVKKVNPDKSIIEGVRRAKINEEDCREDVKEVTEAFLTATEGKNLSGKVSLVFQQHFPENNNLIDYTVRVELEMRQSLSQSGFPTEMNAPQK